MAFNRIGASRDCTTVFGLSLFGALLKYEAASI
jgi:hypothetical protein